MIYPFHLAILVNNLEESRQFYGEILGFQEGRSSSTWVDYNMFGHQLVIHLNTQTSPNNSSIKHSSQVDGDQVPIPHFGVVLDFDNWLQLSERLRPKIDKFLIEPHIRFAGKQGEQGTMFFLDPSGNALEFKGFRDIDRDLFANTLD